MKGKLFLIIFIFFIINQLVANKSTLIDFNRLKANGKGFDPTQNLDESDPKMLDYTNHDPKNRMQHMPTVINYGIIVDDNFSDTEKKSMVTSLAAYNWRVKLNSSAAHVDNVRNSMCIEWHTKAVPILRDPSTDFISNNPAGYTILGIRIQFPESPNNNWAFINPPFNIPAFDDKVTDYRGNWITNTDPKDIGAKYDGYGVLKNVGTIKTIDMRIFGCNYKNSIAVLLEDDNHVVREYCFPDYLDFSGWRKITWTNTNYIENVANRNLFIIPLYPQMVPYVKLKAFRVYRQGDQLGGNFITYIRDVQITYDIAILELDSPIIHEEAWGILQKKAREIKEWEIRQMGYNQVLIFLEKLKIHQETNSN